MFTPPHHSYTDLLLSSVPEMDPDWLSELLEARASTISEKPPHQKSERSENGMELPFFAPRFTLSKGRSVPNGGKTEEPNASQQGDDINGFTFNRRPGHAGRRRSRRHGRSRPGDGRSPRQTEKGGTLRMGIAGANTSDSWDGRTHSDSYMIMMWSWRRF